MRKHERRYTLRGTAQPGDPVGFNDDGRVETMTDIPKAFALDALLQNVTVQHVQHGSWQHDAPLVEITLTFMGHVTDGEPTALAGRKVFVTVTEKATDDD